MEHTPRASRHVRACVRSHPHHAYTARHTDTIATGTTGAAFFAELNRLSPSAQWASVAEGAVRWLAAHVLPSGVIPYILDGTTFPIAQWPLDTMSYVAEGVLAVDAFLPHMHAELAAAFTPSVQWLVRTQNADGTWGTMQSSDQQRSPRVATLLSWYLRTVGPDAGVQAALSKFMSFLAVPANSKTFGVKSLSITSGFVGIAVADFVQYGSTFSGSTV